MTPEDVLQYVEHRPWPLPVKPWAGRMRWCDLAFLHWGLEPDALRRLIPAGLELEIFDGKAWLGIVPFRMEGSRVRFMPAIPGMSDFPELNVRTYVRVGKRFGVWFFSFDAANPVAVRGARTLFNLPYFDASMTVDAREDAVSYRSHRTHRDAPPADFVTEYAATGPTYHAQPGTLDYFLTERYCLFNQERNGELGFLDVHHLPWPLQPATARIEQNTMADAIGIKLAGDAPLVHFSRGVDVVAWNREPLAE